MPEVGHVPWRNLDSVRSASCGEQSPPDERTLVLQYWQKRMVCYAELAAVGWKLAVCWPSRFPGYSLYPDGQVVY